MPSNILMFGFGYTANFLAKKLALLDFHITGTLRNRELLLQHAEKNYELINF